MTITRPIPFLPSLDNFMTARAEAIVEQLVAEHGITMFATMLEPIVQTLVAGIDQHPRATLVPNHRNPGHTTLCCPVCNSRGDDLVTEWSTTIQDDNTRWNGTVLESGSDRADMHIIGYICNNCATPLSLPRDVEVVWN